MDTPLGATKNPGRMPGAFARFGRSQAIRLLPEERVAGGLDGEPSADDVALRVQIEGPAPGKRQKALLIKIMVLTQNPARRARQARSREFGALAMQRSNRMVLRALAMAALVQALGACSSDLSLNNLTLVPKPETLMRKPDWATFSAGKNDFSLRPLTSADFVNQDGQCAGAASADQAAGAEGAAPVGGIALQMTECEVVRRAGPVEKIDISADERGERTVVLSYLRGPAAGVYRFVGGRLVSIERAPGPPPAPAKSQKSTAKKPAGT